jgi:hypothetical protein
MKVLSPLQDTETRYFFERKGQLISEWITALPDK